MMFLLSASSTISRSNGAGRIAPVGLFGLLFKILASSASSNRLVVKHILDNDQLGVLFQKFLQIFNIGDPVLRWIRFPEFYFCPKRSRNGIELLVGRVVTYHMISGTDQRVEDEMICSYGAWGD
jgi:hypothetical protein